MIEISDFVNSLSQNPGLIITILSFIGMIYFYFKGRKVKLAFYYTRSINVVEDLGKFESLKMFYSDKQIENFTITKLVFWNGGSDTIDSQDISSAEPLILRPIESSEILNANIIHVKNSASQFSLDTPDDNSYVKLKFDYLDPGDGAIIQIVHTGTSGEDIEVSGKIKGVGAPVSKLLPQNPIQFSTRFISLSARQSQSLLALGFILLSLFPLYNLLYSPTTLFERIINSITLIVTVSVVILLMKIMIPKGFESFYEEL